MENFEIKRQLDEKYLLKRGLSQVPQILHKKPSAIVKKHKAEVERRLAERMAETNGLMDGVMENYLNLYMEAQIEREVSRMISEESGTENTVEEAREKYKPKKIKCLLIAESPPNALDRFFYYENVGQHDHLFRGVMQVLAEKYDDIQEPWNQYINHGSPKMKKEMLEKFKEHGFFLEDLFECPINEPEPLPVARIKLTNKLNQMVTDNLITAYTPIILIKVTVYDAIFRILRDKEYHVIDVRIPFPNNGWQNQFHKMFSQALMKRAWNV